MLEIRYMEINDKDFWYSLDKHLLTKNFFIRFETEKGMFYWITVCP